MGGAGVGFFCLFFSLLVAGVGVSVSGERTLKNVNGVGEIMRVQ